MHLHWFLSLFLMKRAIVLLCTAPSYFATMTAVSVRVVTVACASAHLYLDQTLPARALHPLGTTNLTCIFCLCVLSACIGVRVCGLCFFVCVLRVCSPTRIEMISNVWLPYFLVCF